MFSSPPHAIRANSAAASSSRSSKHKQHKITKTSVDKFKQQLRAESLVALEKSLSSTNTPDGDGSNDEEGKYDTHNNKAWYLLSFDELVTEYHYQEELKDVPDVVIASDRCSVGNDSCVDIQQSSPLSKANGHNNSVHTIKGIGRPSNPVGFGSSSSPRISLDDTINYFPATSPHSNTNKPLSPQERIKQERRKQHHLQEELRQTQDRIAALAQNKQQHYKQIVSLVHKIGVKEDELHDLQEKGSKLYIQAANALSQVRSQQAAKLASMTEEAEDPETELDLSAEEIVQKNLMISQKTGNSGRRSSIVSVQKKLNQQYPLIGVAPSPSSSFIQADTIRPSFAQGATASTSASPALSPTQRQQRAGKQIQQTAANSMVRAANVAALRFQRSRDDLWTKTGQQRAQDILDAVEEHERVRYLIRRALIRFGREHREKMEAQGLWQPKQKQPKLIKFIRPTNAGKRAPTRNRTFYSTANTATMHTNTTSTIGSNTSSSSAPAHTLTQTQTLAQMHHHQIHNNHVGFASKPHAGTVNTANASSKAASAVTTGDDHNESGNIGDRHSRLDVTSTGSNNGKQSNSANSQTIPQRKFTTFAPNNNNNAGGGKQSTHAGVQQHRPFSSASFSQAQGNTSRNEDVNNSASNSNGTVTHRPSALMMLFGDKA
jgi:hypothetical protein